MEWDFSGNSSEYEDSGSHLLQSPLNSNYSDNSEYEEEWLSGNWSNSSGIGLPLEFSKGFQIFIYVIYNVVFVMALFGNSLVLYVVYSQPRMRTATNLLLANLASGDLVICLLCLPFTYISVLYHFWPFGFLCYLVSPANTIGVLVSSFTLVALALDRYFAIVHPFRPRLRKKYACFVILGIWGAAIITASPIAAVTDLIILEGLPLCVESGWPPDTNLIYTILLLVLQYIFPIIVLIFTYSSIGIIVWGKGQGVTSLDNNGQQARRPIGKTVVVTFAVVIGYTAAWLPLNAFTVYIHMFHPRETEVTTYVFFGCHFIAMSHTTYNPIIYAFINQTFRREFKIVFLTLLEKCQGLFQTPSQRGASLQHRSSVWSSGRSAYYCQVNGNLRRISSPTSIKTTSTNVTN